MTGRRWILVCLGCAGIVVGVLYLLSRSGERGSKATPSASSVTAASSLETFDSATGSERRQSAEESHPEAALGLPPAPTPAVSHGRDKRGLRVRLDGRVLDDRERPLAGAEVWLDGGPALARADEDGLFEGAAEVFEDPQRKEYWGGSPGQFEIGAHGFASAIVWREFEDGESVHLGTVRLVPGGEVRGRVLGETGRPVGLALVRWGYAEESVQNYDGEWPEILVQREPRTRAMVFTDADGRFRLRGVPAEEVFLIAVAFGSDFGQSEAFRVFPGEVHERTLTLEPGSLRGVRVAGRVLDPEGRAIEGVQVKIEADKDWVGEAISGEDGRFEKVLELVPGVRSLFLQAVDPAQRGYPAGVEAALDSGPVEIRLEAGRYFDVQLVDGDEKAVSWGHLRLQGDKRDRTWLGPRLVPIGELGEKRLLLPRAPFSLEAMAPGFRNRSFGPFEPSAIEGPLVLQLQSGQVVRGRVLAGGRPLDSARVGLQQTSDPTSITSSQQLAIKETPFLCFGSSPAAPDDATTDSTGGFAVTLHNDGWHALVVEAEGFPLTVFGPYRWSRDAGADGLELVLKAAGSIDGVLRTSPGRSPAGRLVGVCNGWAAAATAIVGSDGRYRIDGLAAGSYQVRECEAPASAYMMLSLHRPAGAEMVWDCEVRPGEVTRFDLDRRGEEDFVLEGRLELPPEKHLWEARLYRNLESGRGGELRRVPLDSEGRFRMALSEGGSTSITVLNGPLVFSQELELEPGLNEWAATPDWGALRWLPPELPQEEGGRRLIYRWSGEGGLTFRWSGWWSASEAEPKPIWVPAGPGVLECGPFGAKKDLELPVLIREGEESVVRFRAAPAPR